MHRFCARYKPDMPKIGKGPSDVTVVEASDVSLEAGTTKRLKVKRNAGTPPPTYSSRLFGNHLSFLPTMPAVVDAFKSILIVIAFAGWILLI